MSYPKEGLAGHSSCHIQKKDWQGIVSVILKEGLVGHNWCHTKGRIGGA